MSAIHPPVAAATESFTIRPLTRSREKIAAAVMGIVALAVLWSFISNPRLDWPTVWTYLFAEMTIRGVWVTIYLTVISMLIGVVGGTLVAIMSLSRSALLRSVALGYVTIFRGTPVLVQIIFWGFLGAFFPNLIIGIPFTDIVFWTSPTSSLISATTAAILALGLNEVAYASEIVRAGIKSVDPGQQEAASALGMSGILTMRRIVLPQAMRVVVPPMGNEFITLLKTSSLVSVIAGNDLLTNMQRVYAQNYKVIPLLVVASIWYLALTLVLTAIQQILEKRFGRGVGPRAAKVKAVRS